MAVPTITSITPSSGLTGGGTLVSIAGSNFRLPTPPPATGPSTPRGPSVRVSFVGTTMTKASPRVLVLATNLLLVEVPFQDPGAAAVRVENLNDAGAPIAGEVVEVAAGYTYARPDLAELAQSSNLVRVVRALIKDLKRQIIENVYLTVHSDYDGSTGDNLNIVDDAKLPALVLIGPTFRENRMYGIAEQRSIPDPNDSENGFLILRNPPTVDLEFQIFAASDSTMQLIVLQGLLTQYLHRNERLVMLREHGNPSAGEVAYELEKKTNGDLASNARANESNVRQVQGEIVIRGFDLDEVDMVIMRGKKLVEYAATGADAATAALPASAMADGLSSTATSPVILGSDPAGVAVVGQGGGGTSGGAENPPPDGIEFEQIKP